ncbi:DUF1028 domain-containing protein [candidate division TA06 bacterium]|nr:DUF1028 domain-containing protein [candidate division TA06 bacterium]
MKSFLCCLMGWSALGGFAEPVGATFSIVAIDPSTGEVGSAGASCIANSQIINDPIGAIGSINTQAYYRSDNQQYAHSLMELGLSPQEIIDSLIVNDAQGNPTIRQYGIVDLVGGGRSAAYTGVNTSDWKGHRTGTTYAIQGNILLDSTIVESMEVIFNLTPGSLSDRLMAALEAAKVPGADTRCLVWGKSSISAFIHVVLPDSTDYPYLVVSNTPTSVDPIDSLRILYDAWRDTITGVEENSEFRTSNFEFRLVQNHPNPFHSTTLIRYSLPGIRGQGSGISGQGKIQVSLTIYNITGRLVETLVDLVQEPGVYQVQWKAKDQSSGIYFYRLQANDFISTKKLILLR